MGRDAILDEGRLMAHHFGITFGSALENGSLVVGNTIVIELAVEAHQSI